MTRLLSVVRRTTPILALAVAASAPGCNAPEAPAGPPADAPAAAESGLSLPEGYKVVDKPLELRKKVHAAAANHRLKALEEANAKLPMDEAHLPKNDKEAFDRRMAEHKAILDDLIAKGFAEIAREHGVAVEDIVRIEDEANRLRWLPPQPPAPAPAPKAAPAPPASPEAAPPAAPSKT